MQHLPPVVWGVVVAVALLLLGLCFATAYAVVRARARRHIAPWPGRRVAALLIASWLPWLAVRLANMNIEVNVHGVLQAVGWLLVALATFALLVLLPLAALLAVVVWWLARHERRLAAQ
jgi:hypothetical protein